MQKIQFGSKLCIDRSEPSEKIHISLPTSLLQRFTAECGRRNISRSRGIANLMQAYLDQEKIVDA